MKRLLILLILTISASVSAATANIWPSIPFIRGADLCAYKQAYSQTRMEYMHEMTAMASELMNSGATGGEALNLLVSFDALYDKNVRLATQHKYLDVTLENTLKGYLDQFYRERNIVNRNIQFKHINSIQRIITDASNGQRVGHLPNNTFEYLDFVAYGTYSLAPNCKGNILVTISLVGSDGTTRTYKAEAAPNVVMSRIAASIFEDFQRTQFPSTINLGNRTIKILGTPSGSVAVTNNLRTAKMACEMIGGRLPNSNELEMISSYGDWNGGVSINRAVWALSQYGSLKVYHPGLMNPSPVRNLHEINSRTINYYCVK